MSLEEPVGKLALGKRFDSFESFDTARKKYENENNINFVIKSSNKLTSTRKRVLSDDELLKFKYKYILFVCKFGGEPSKLTNIRSTKSYKCNCMARCQIDFVVDDQQFWLKVTVLSAISVHNHDITREAFLSLPRQRALSVDSSKNFIDSALNVQPNFRLLQNSVNDASDAVGKVILKDLYNRKAKLNKADKKSEQFGDLYALVREMEGISGSTVHVIETSNDIQAIYFQDEQMKKMFSIYPEVLMCDATYSVNNRNMPLQIVMVVDGNGESHIVALFIIRSESVQIMKGLFEIFADENENTSKIDVIMVDKHASNLATFGEMFPNAKIHLCVFHVQQIFSREITTKKRNISENDKKAALKIVNQMIYCKTESEYNDLYSQLDDVASYELMEYFDQYWHSVDKRPMWAGYLVNEFNHFENRTNNRLESLNQKIKSLVTRYGSLQKFFKDTMAVIQSMDTEKQHRIQTHSLKQVVRNENEQDFEFKYRSLITNFAFQHLQKEIEAMNKVQFSRIEEEVAYRDERMTTRNNCNCAFSLKMLLPCKHILVFRQLKSVELYDAVLCNQRWHKDTIKKAKSVSFVASTSQASTSQETQISVISTQAPRRMTKNQKFHKAKSVLHGIVDALIDLPQPLFDVYMKEFEEAADHVATKKLFVVNVDFTAAETSKYRS